MTWKTTIMEMMQAATNGAEGLTLKSYFPFFTVKNKTNVKESVIHMHAESSCIYRSQGSKFLLIFVFLIWFLLDGFFAAVALSVKSVSKGKSDN